MIRLVGGGQVFILFANSRGSGTAGGQVLYCDIAAARAKRLTVEHTAWGQVLYCDIAAAGSQPGVTNSLGSTEQPGVRSCIATSQTAWGQVLFCDIAAARAKRLTVE